MITEIPTADEFHEAGVNQIYLAWQIAMQAALDYERATEYAPDLEEHEAIAAATEYWRKSQPVLANAFGLVQQAMEMALKGRIAAVSPYLLIARDPKDWPSGVDARAIPFSEFRTLDAADLVKVHNTFASTPLEDAFRMFWDGVRRDRNKLMHSVSLKTFEPSILIRTILMAIEALFAEISWPTRLLIMEEEGKYAAYGIGSEDTHNIVMSQVQTAISYLTNADGKRFFNFDSRRRAYTCPECWMSANRDFQEIWPALAQLTSKAAGSTMLHCVVCAETTEVQRMSCVVPDCRGDVIHDDTCLTCLASQSCPHNFYSGLEAKDKHSSNEYVFSFRQGQNGSDGYSCFPDDASAIEHARLAMQAVHLLDWQAVTVTLRKLGFFEGNGFVRLGTWSREADGTVWHQGETAQPPGLWPDRLV